MSKRNKKDIFEKEYSKLISFILKFHPRILKEYQKKINKGEPVFIGKSRIE